MEPTTVTPYEQEQVEQIAAWKGRRPGMIRRTMQSLRRTLGRPFKSIIPAGEARAIFSKLHRAADWELARHEFRRTLEIERIEDLRAGPLERCDRLVKKQKELGHEIITTESLLANVGGLATELMELPAEIMLAVRTVHRVAACYGYSVRCPDDETLILAIIGMSLIDDPETRTPAGRLVDELIDGRGTKEDTEQLATEMRNELEEEVGDDLVMDIGSTLLDEKLSEGIPFVGAGIGVVLDNAFIAGVEEAAQRIFQERWLRDQRKVKEIAPTEAPPLTFAASLSQGAYATGYAVGFGVVLPSVLVARAGAAVLPGAALDGLSQGAATASKDADRLIAGVLGQPDPTSLERLNRAPLAESFPALMIRRRESRSRILGPAG